MKNLLKGPLLRTLLDLFFMVAMIHSSKAFCENLHKTQPDMPIQIQSDTASIEQLKRQATYEGNVILTQGGHILHADKLTLKKDESGRLSLITAIGAPATFEGKFDLSTHPVHATAKMILYYPDKQLLVLQGEATMEHQQDKFKGPMLSYQMDKQIISASKQSDERPTITIHPRV